MHHSTQSTVMEGMLAGTVTLGVCKSTCDLLSLPTVGESLNSVCFCCGCLLIFTDLTVTAFLALLWLAEPWLHLFPVPSDVITLRFLLFLGHTYGAALLLTVLLIAMETACKLLLAGRSRVDREEPGGAGNEVWRKGGGSETGGGDAGAEERAEVARLFSPVPGFLCSLLAWALCGVWAGRRYLSEQLRAEACILRTASLSPCLPDLASITLSACSDPFITLPAFILLLALPVGLSLGRGRTSGRAGPRMPRPMPWAAIDEKAPHVVGVRPRVPQATPALAATVAHPPCLSAELDWEQSPKVICCGRVNTQMPSDPGQRTATAHTHPASRRSALWERLSGALCGPAGPQTHTRSSCRTLGVSLLAGLLCAAALYLLPPCLAVNPILISSVGSLAERSLKH
ncbi:uncharacterized protein LOC118210927 isoform X2 [Anguilla anguilla]|uniref:uncharacterized protein LOC118210927 isoform X2 n=1 Tax=Anguilla anguilla TaxID=7936 RepID=UPI0015AAB4AC|nr:uncharacterized protein LOC118210927 isoform X2 [Anguilla anguilla]